jgi:cardiolipin synthase
MLSIKFMSQLPNILTKLRLVMAPLVAWALVCRHNRLALVLVSLAYITDFLDGYLARLWSVQSEWGRMWDPIADKMLGLCLFIPLTFVHRIVPPSLLFSMLSRDVFIGIIYALLRHHIALNPEMGSPLLIGKIHTVVQATFGIVVLLPFLAFSNPFLVGTLWATTWLSGVAYAYRTWTLWKLLP